MTMAAWRPPLRMLATIQSRRSGGVHAAIISLYLPSMYSSALQMAAATLLPPLRPRATM